MEENFEIPVNYNNQEFLFPARAITTGYSYKIEIEVDGEIVYLEPDEEGNFRLLLNQQHISSNLINEGKLRAIMETLNSVK